MRVTLYDTTLRDGEQSPGVCFSPEQKLDIARKLVEVGVQEFDAGFPVVSEEERKAVRLISGEGLGAKVLALARALEEDINACVECDVDGVIIFIATSDLHLRYKLRISKEEVEERVADAVEYAAEHFNFVQLACEDATRTDLNFLKRVYRRAEAAGAKRVTVADTVGTIHPVEMGSLVKNVKKDIGIPIAVHCHNDFGLAVANSLSAIENGAEAVSCTVNGIGERAGNAPLEEMVMALKYLYGVDLGFKTEVLRELSEMVSRYSGIPVPGNKPVVGDNIFTHESGLHVSAVLRNPLTYEPFPPEEVGQRRRISFGKHSGLEAVKYKLREIGVRFSEGDARRVLEMIKRRREGGEEITEEILQGIVREVLHGSGR